MRVLTASLEGKLRPELAWSREVQERVSALLARGRERLLGIDLDGWRTLEAEWRAFLDRFTGPVRAAAGKAPDARLVGERSYEGFRVQNVVFESFPGWQVGLNLFLPAGPGPHVPVLCPCGHGPKWQDDHQLPPQVLARAGFAAALFDMPMFGEKAQANDHFIQGSQSAMVGTWSNFYFLVDALRAADYLYSRPDVDVSRGMGVTGVSGGGVAAMFLASIDARVRALAPVCSVASLGGHIIEGLYTGCPETYMPGQALAGFDIDHLLCLAAPLPCLVAAGTADELFRKDCVERSVDQARRIYELQGAGDRLSLFFDNSPHAYTLPMANQAAAWFRLWLRGAGPGEPAARVDMLSREDLDCGTAASTDGMLQVIRREALRLGELRAAGQRSAPTDEEIREVCRVVDPDSGAVELLPKSDWGYPRLQKLVLHSAKGLSLPALSAVFPEAPEGTLACFVDDGKLGPLRQQGGFFGACRRILSADLRGFGELAPEPSDYDLYSWCSVDRALSDLIILCGGNALGEQVGDALRVLDYAGGEGPLSVCGRGEAALPAFFAGLLHGRVSRIALDSYPCSFESIAVSAAPAWSRYAYLPGVLQHFDIPELVRQRAGKRFLLYRPCGADKVPLREPEARKAYAPLPSHVELHAGTLLPGAPDVVRAWLAR